jgi:stage V sporulation protein B
VGKKPSKILTRLIMEKSRSATKGFAVLSAAELLIKILSVIYIPVLLQIVGDIGYGIYNAGYQIYVFIYVLTNSGFPVAISKLQAELIAHENFRDARRSFAIARLLLTIYGLIMSVVTIVYAKQITSVLGYDRSYLVILALSPTMLFSAISSAYRGYFNGYSNMKPTAVSKILEQFLNVSLSLLFAVILKPFGIEWACAGATVGTTLGSLGSALYLHYARRKSRSHLNLKTPAYVKRLRTKIIIYSLLSYSIPIAINSIVVFGGNIVDLWNTKLRLIAGGFTSDQSYIKYGVLGKYSQLLNVPLAITAALQVAMIPTLSTVVALKDNKLLKSHISEIFKLSLLLSIPAAVGLAVLSKPVFLLLFSQKYIDGWYLMAIGSVVIVLTTIVQIQSGILQVLNKTGLSTISMLFGIFIKIFINYFLIAMPSINITGAVIGTIVCYLIAAYVNSKFIRKILPVNVVIKKHFGRPIIASAAMAVIVAAIYRIFLVIFQSFMGSYISNALSTIAAIAAGAFTYMVIMIKIGGITMQDLDNIPYSNKIKKFIPKSVLSMAKIE